MSRRLDVDVMLLSAYELASELGARVRRERLRQNMTQRTLADRAGVGRATVARMEQAGSATLPNFLAVLAALHRTGDLQQLLEPPPVETIDRFVARSEPQRQRGRR
ncbi:MAG: helix-turn-helix transcriptional regulator [Actinobacteria bacterium]|nr:helix-turn-helix transcriptional regulator [Actinomycetota bacterium]